MRTLLLLLLLGVWLDQDQAKKTIQTGIKQHEVFEAIPTQIEGPPEVQEEDDDEDEDEDEDGWIERDPTATKDEDDATIEDDEDDETDAIRAPLRTKQFDLDYVVNRPTSSPEDDGPGKCKDNDDIAEEGDLDCEVEGSEMTPYKKYKAYKNWKRRPLFVIIIGGLRWDYLTKSDWNMTQKTVGSMKAFNWIKKHGTTMSQVVPVYPPYDLPTWTSLATGLYPKNTGVVGDYMFNLKSRELFSREDPDVNLDNWWTNGEPIWSVAAKHGRKVSVLNWHDCSLPGKNIENPDDCRPFSPAQQPKSKKMLVRLFNKAITKIHKDGYDLSIVYIDNLKRAAKQFGPNSQEVMQELANIDEVLQGRLSDIKTKKERADLKLNILLLSDFGLNGINKTTKVVLDDYLEFNHTQYIIQRGGSCILVPYALRAGDIMRGIPGKKLGVANMIGVNAYVRDINLEIPPLNYPEIPEDLNYDGLTWTQDILLVAKPGFEIEIHTDSSKILPPLNDDQGMSGYHPQPLPPYIVPGRDKHKSKETRAREKKEVWLYNQFAHMMKTIGFAWGPDFKPGFESDPVEIVDLYQIMAFLLKIPPNTHDGNWDRIRSMLMINSATTTSCVSLIMSLVCVMVLRQLA